MGSVDSSPNYTRARSRFDQQKQNSPGGSESDEIMSICGSAVIEPHARKLANNGITQRSSNKKTTKNLETVRSFRRRPKPRLIQSPLPLSDDDHYLKATTSSAGKNSESDRSSSQLSRTPSLINVRILMKRASFRPKRSLLRYSKASQGVAVDRATYSSTIRDSKFPSPVELQLHPSREESDKSAVKVCRYHHCSLHGGCHGSGESAPPLKRFLYKRKQSLRSMVPKAETTRGVKISCDRKRNLHKRVISPEVESLNQERFSESIAISGVEKGKVPNEETEQFADGYNDVQEAYLVELAFGETSFPERSYRDSQDILRKYSSGGQDLGGVSSRCSCHNREESTFTPKTIEATATSLDKEIPEKASAAGLDTSIDDVAVSCNDGPDTPVVSDEKTKKRNAYSSASSSSNSSEEDAEFTTESPPAEEDFKVHEGAQVDDSETKTPTNNEGGLHFSKPRHMSMWNLIHQHMSSNVPTEATDKDIADVGAVASDSDSETREVELRKMFAVKLVREAIEKILLPEVQDQASDDQSVTSETTPRPELTEKDQNAACIQENDAETGADSANGVVSSSPKEEPVVADDAEEVVRKSEKKAPKHWSNLKKWILLQRFIKALERVRRFDPKKPRHLPLNPDPEAEKISLRPQTVDERKSAEEWMLDHALRQAVSQLAPTQKKKVALLVKAFETVVPPQEEESPSQRRIPRLRSVSIFDSPCTSLARDDPSGDPKSSDENGKLEDHGHKENGEPVSKARSLNVDGDGMSVQLMEDETKTEGVPEAVQGLQEDAISHSMVMEGKTKDRKKHIKMWHMIYQHVVSDIAEKVGDHLLDGSEDEEQEEDAENHPASSKLRGGLTKSDALKLVKQAVDEILVPEAQDDASDTQSVSSDSVQDEVGGDEDLRVEPKAEFPKSRNWSKLKKLLLLKRSIKALEKARDYKLRAPQVLPRGPDPEPEKVDLRQQMMDERKKAEQWMLDYAVQHIVTTLTPARKRRVAMLVEAFEAVVPLPEA